MKLARRDFKAKEEKIQTGGTPGSKRSSSGKKLDSAAIDKTWVSVSSGRMRPMTLPTGFLR